LLYRFEDFALDTDRRELCRGRSQIPLAPQVFDLLEFLIRNRQRIVSKDDLIASIWNGRIVSESALTTRINATRSAIHDDGKEQRLIRTVPRKGLRFVGTVREEPDPSDKGARNAVSGPELPLPDRPSIAVLPFTNMSGEPEQDYFAEGMAEEIITALSRCSWLFVIARNSSFAYRGVAVDVRTVGRELGVRYVLEGSVRRGGNRLRLTGQLIDAVSGVHLWADRFEGDADDVFDLQDRFTENLVAAVDPTLQRAEIERLRHRSAANLDAYDLFLKAQQAEAEFTEQSLAEALRLLQQALVMDPGYAPAMALAAYCHALRFAQGWAKEPDAERRTGLSLATLAAERGKDDGRVFWMTAYAVHRLRMEPSHAKELADRSLELNPNSAIALSVAGRIELVLGNTSKALELLLRAERLSPRDPRGWFIIGGGTAYAYFAAGRYDESIAAANKALIQNPRFALALRFLAASLAKRGRRDAAAQAIREVLEIEPRLTLTKLRARSMFMDANAWKKYSEALRLAGLPD
jgi:TolB-like protein